MEGPKDIEEFFGTLQESVVGSWRKHLKTDKHNVHEILDDFYKEMPEKVDKLIEDYMGIFGKVEEYKNTLPEKDMDCIEYLEQLRTFTKSGRKLIEGETELESDTDDILGFIDSTLYKLKELTKTNESLIDFIKNAMINA